MGSLFTSYSKQNTSFCGQRVKKAEIQEGIKLLFDDDTSKKTMAIINMIHKEPTAYADHKDSGWNHQIGKYSQLESVLIIVIPISDDDTTIRLYIFKVKGNSNDTSKMEEFMWTILKEYGIEIITGLLKKL
jgi:hypothetical protein